MPLAGHRETAIGRIKAPSAVTLLQVIMPVVTMCQVTHRHR
jgi:hypothetical protein